METHHRLRYVVLVGCGLVGCVSIEGDCTLDLGTTVQSSGITQGRLHCNEGGKASIFAPSYSIESTGTAVKQAEQGKAENTRAQTELVKAETQQAASAPALAAQKQLDKPLVPLPLPPVKPKPKK